MFYCAENSESFRREQLCLVGRDAQAYARPYLADEFVTRKRKFKNAVATRSRKFAGNRDRGRNAERLARKARSKGLIPPSIKRDHPITGVLP